MVAVLLAHLLVLCTIQSVEWHIGFRTCLASFARLDRLRDRHRWCSRLPVPLLLAHDEENRGRAGPRPGSTRFALGAALRQSSPIGNRALQLSLADAKPPAPRGLCLLSCNRIRYCARLAARRTIGSRAQIFVPGLSHVYISDDGLRDSWPPQRIFAAHLTHCELGFAYHAALPVTGVHRSNQAVPAGLGCRPRVACFGLIIVLLQAVRSSSGPFGRTRVDRIHSCRS